MLCVSDPAQLRARGSDDASATASALRFQSSCSAGGVGDTQHVQRVDAIEIRARQRVAIAQCHGVLEQGNRRGLVAARIARAAALQQVADAHAHRHLVELRRDGVECRIRLGELPLQTLRARDLRRGLERFARACRMPAQARCESALRFRGLAVVPQLVETLGKVRGRGLAHGDGSLQQRNGRRQHAPPPRDRLAVRAHELCRRGASRAARAPVPAPPPPPPAAVRDPRSRCPRRPWPCASRCVRCAPAERARAAKRSRAACGVVRRSMPRPAGPQRQCSRPGRAPRTARIPSTAMAARRACASARRGSRRPDRRRCTACSRCTPSRRRRPRAVAPCSPHCGSSGCGARPVSAASATMTASPPGGQRLMSAAAGRRRRRHRDGRRRIRSACTGSAAAPRRCARRGIAGRSVHSRAFYRPAEVTFARLLAYQKTAAEKPAAWSLRVRQPNSARPLRRCAARARVPRALCRLGA